MNEKERETGTDWERPVVVDVSEGLDHIWDGEGFCAVPVAHAVRERQSDELA
jgi:hypothetical protein